MLWRLGTALGVLVLWPASFAAQAPAAPNTTSQAEPDVTIERSHIKVAFERDGTSVEDTEIALRPTTVAGVEDAGTVVIPFLRDLAQLRVSYVRVRKPSGAVVETPVSSAIDMPAEITTAAPTFTDLYTKNINVQGLEPGDAVEYAYSIRQTPLLPGQFWYEHSFDADAVILEQTVEVSWPATVQATAKSGPGVEAVAALEAGRQIYRWRHRNPTVLDPKALAVRYYDRLDTRADIQVTSFRSWAELGEAFRTLWRDRAAVTPEIRDRARQLTAGANTPEERARALYSFVSSAIRYVAVNMGIGRFRPHSAAEVLANGFGDCKDKHTLLAALLRAVDIDAEPALIGPGMTSDPDIPSPAQFSHVITVVPGLGSAPVWLDATLGVAPFGFIMFPERDVYALRVPASAPPTLVRTPKEPARPNRLRTETTGTLSEEGRLQATVRESFSGDLEVGMRVVFRQLPRARWVDFVKALPLAQTFGGTVSDVRISAVDDTRTEFQIDYSYAVDTFSNWKERTIYPPAALQLPDLPAVDRPSVPIEMGLPGEMVAITRIELASTIRARLAANVKDAVVIERDGFRYESKVGVQGQVVTAERHWSTTSLRVPVADVDAYRKFLTEVRGSRYNVDLTVAQPWAWGETANIDWYRDAPPDVTKTLQGASAASQRRDYQEALAAVRDVLKANPESDPAWQMLGYVELQSGDRERGLDTLRRRAQVTGAAHLLKYFAGRLTAFAMHEEALRVWQRGHDLFPDDRDFTLYLGEALVRAGRHADAAAVLGPLQEQQAKSARFHTNIGRAQLGTGRIEEGIAALRRSAELDSSANNLNNVAWDLATRRLVLPDARTYAERAVREESVAIGKLSLASLNAADVRRMSSLAAYMDTLGRVLVEQGETQTAERWLMAAWNLGAQPAFALNLADMYERTERREQAEQFVALAAALADAAGMTRLTKLVPDPQRRGALLRDAQTALPHRRSLTFAKPAGFTGESRVFLVVSRTGVIEDVRMIGSGSDSAALASALKAMRVNWTSPDDTISQIVRRASVQCPASGDCSLSLHRAGDVTTVD